MTFTNRKTSLPVVSSCDGCVKKPSCKTPCADVLAQLEVLPPDLRSVPFFDDRLRGPVDRDEEDDEPGLWARFVESAGPLLPVLARRLPVRERFVVLGQLAGHSTETLARALGVTGSAVQRTRQRALALLLQRLGSAFPRTSHREALFPIHASVMGLPASSPVRDDGRAKSDSPAELPRARPRIQCAVPYLKDSLI